MLVNYAYKQVNHKCLSNSNKKERKQILPASNPKDLKSTTVAVLCPWSSSLRSLQKNQNKMSNNLSSHLSAQRPLYQCVYKLMVGELYELHSSCALARKQLIWYV